jgi:hypothetical protein
MTTTIQLESIQWSSLPDIDRVEPVSDRDAEILADLKAVLERHGATERFGVCLLHRHFDLADDECLMESTDVGQRVSVLNVEKRTDSPARIPTMWRFGPTITAETKCQIYCLVHEGPNGGNHIYRHANPKPRGVISPLE